MASHRQIKIKYENSEPFFVESVQEAVRVTGCSKTSVRNCLNGDIKSCKGYTFSYAQVKPSDKTSNNQKDSTKQANQDAKSKQIKVTNVKTNEVKIYPSRTNFADEMEVSSQYVYKLIKNKTLFRDTYLIENYTYVEEEEVCFKRAEEAISKVQNGDIRAKLAGLLSQVRYDKFDAVQPKQIREILPFKQWVNDSYYSGPDSINLYPYWKEYLSTVFDSDKNITESIMGGSIGTGKTTASLYGIMYKLYTLSCYENVAGLFNLMVTSKIALMYFTINMKQAEKLGYGQLKNMIDSTPYFQEHFPRFNRISSKLVFPENVEITYGSSNNQAIGLNLIASLLDEANFFKEASDETTISAVYELYSSILARGRSRYMHRGWNHSICFLVSSSTHKGSFTEKRISEGRKENFEHMCVATPRLWDVKPPGTYSDERFYVFGGNNSIDPLILSNVQDINKIRGAFSLPLLDTDDIERACLQTAKDINTPELELVIPIPVDFRKDFENDIIKGLQDIAGYSTSPSGYLFSSRPMYNKCISDNCKHPFIKSEICLSTDSKEQLWDYLAKGYTFPNKNQPHFISVDASTKHDSTGISMIHLKDIEVDEFGNTKPIIQVDFMLRITPPLKPFEIDIAKIREFIRYLRDTQDINIYGVSYDQYASTESLQLLRQQGFNAIQQSVIRSDVPHKDFVHIVQEGRLLTYKYNPFESELFNMMHDRVRRKVFVAPGTTAYHGDTYMSLIGCIMHLTKELEFLPLTNENLTAGEDLLEDQYEIDVNEMMDTLVDGALNGLVEYESVDDLFDEDDDFIDYM